MLAFGAEFNTTYGPPDWVPRYTLYPTTVDVLAVQDRLTVGCGAWVPVPVSVSAVDALLALLKLEASEKKPAESQNSYKTVTVAQNQCCCQRLPH